MKILMPHYEIQDYGGITNSTSGLVRGYQAHGHEVDLVMMRWRPHTYLPDLSSRFPGGEDVTGLVIDQRSGYKFPPARQFHYRGAAGIKAWKRFVKNYDLVHWQVPIPTANKLNRGNSDWPHLYDISVPQIAHSHDGNIFNTPWFSVIAETLRGVGCVHTCALNGAAEVLPVPLSLVPSPQWDVERRFAKALPGDQREGFLTLQTFKRWKRVDDIVRAIPFMESRERKQVAGGGIERYYMTSQTKVKPEYMWRPKDKGYREEFNGQSIWNVALGAGMKYLDFVDNETRDKLLRRRVALIDASWSNTYARYGAHFNRVVIDALVCGAVPIMRDWGDKTSPLVAGKHYIALPPTEQGPEAQAALIDEVLSQDWTEWMEDARQILAFFDCRYASKIFLELAEGEGTIVGRKNTTFISKGRAAMEGFFAPAGQSS